MLERSEHVAEWVRLTAEKVAQLAPPSGGRQPVEAGIRKAAKEIGVNRREAQRPSKIDASEPDAKAAAIAAGMGDNQSALLKVAQAPSEQQIDQVAHLARQRADRKLLDGSADAIIKRDAAASAAFIIVGAIFGDEREALVGIPAFGQNMGLAHICLGPDLLPNFGE